MDYIGIGQLGAAMGTNLIPGILFVFGVMIAKKNAGVRWIVFFTGVTLGAMSLEGNARLERMLGS